MKRDGNPVREVDQDKFTILSKEEHKVQIELKEQFLTCRFKDVHIAPPYD